MLTSGRTVTLAAEALALKKAWLLAALWLGVKLSGREREIPDYQRWTRRDLETHLVDLRADTTSALRKIAELPSQRDTARAAKWFAAQFDRWLENSRGPFSVCTVKDFETQVGRLRARKTMEVPAYGELLMQGAGFSVAIRHPEYMLARDLALLYGLLLDAENLLKEVDWSHPPIWAGAASENSQSLARATIITCFNLLESFVSGLAREYLMEHPRVPENTREKLVDTRAVLRTRLLTVPRIVSGKEAGEDPNQPPMSVMFGEIKRRRDAFIHCEPGPFLSQRGYVKEAAFHKADKDAADEAVDATFQIIRQTWKLIHNADGPRWLPRRDAEWRLHRNDLRLATPPAP